MGGARLMNLAQKYAPKAWSEVVGQDNAVNRLAALGKRGFAGRAFWITGASGTGKTTIAKLLAGEIADPFCTTEIDAGDLTAERLRSIEREQSMYGFGAKTGRVFIVNEAHGLRAAIIRALLVTLERIPEHVAWIFTTTVDGQETLFADQIDAHPLLSRCTLVALTRQGLSKPFAEHARTIAGYEGLNGKPIASYMRLAQNCHNNLRAMLSYVEFGEML